jgi:fructokinase|tara:strand:- start:5698 stop:6588 length:891 start_codon:yes stop_codon:yes gene_type:complete
MSKAFKVAGIGEVLWDINGDVKKIGGAPANFTFHCKNLGADAFLISSLGNDKLGLQIINFFKNRKINISAIDINQDKSTGIVDVNLNHLKNAQYKIKDDNIAWDHIIFDDNKSKIASSLDAICFGTLAQRNSISKESIHKVLKSVKKDCLIMFDMNLRQHYHNTEIILSSIELANSIKINEEELNVISNILKISGSKKELIKTIHKKFNLRLLILTCGENGAYILRNNELSFKKPPKIKNVISTVGAGDCFTSAVVMGYLNNNSLDEINKQANLLASFVCTQNSAVPEIPKELIIN